MRDALLEVTPLMVHAVKWLRKKSDLQPPIALLDHTQVLRELMSVYKSSLMGDESEEDVRSGFKPVLDKPYSFHTVRTVRSNSSGYNSPRLSGRLRGEED